jgi:alpha-L-rhamnosidase
LRRAQTGWDTPSFDDRRWHAAELVKPREPKIEWQYFQPVRIEKMLKAKTTTNPAPRVYVYDFGQNPSGVARLRARGAAATDVKLRFY